MSAEVTAARSDDGDARQLDPAVFRGEERGDGAANRLGDSLHADAERRRVTEKDQPDDRRTDVSVRRADRQAQVGLCIATRACHGHLGGDQGGATDRAGNHCDRRCSPYALGQAHTYPADVGWGLVGPD